jgi:hypothetical protein
MSDDVSSVSYKFTLFSYSVGYSWSNAGLNVSFQSYALGPGKYQVVSDKSCYLLFKVVFIFDSKFIAKPLFAESQLEVKLFAYVYC